MRMSDLIDREALLRQIDIDSEGEPGYYGDTWKFIDTIKSMPPAQLSTNLAEVGTDCISRQAAIDALENDKAALDKIIKGMSAMDVRLDAYVSQRNQVVYDIYAIKQLPPIQLVNCSEFPNNSDVVDRQKAKNAICNACGKIDCDEMDTCEKLDIPSEGSKALE